MPPPEPVSKRLVLFPPGTPPERRRRRLIFLTLACVAMLAVNWPIYALFSGTFPLVAGLPLSLAWIVFWLAVVFCAQVWLFRHEA